MFHVNNFAHIIAPRLRKKLQRLTLLWQSIYFLNLQLPINIHHLWIRFKFPRSLQTLALFRQQILNGNAENRKIQSCSFLLSLPRVRYAKCCEATDKRRPPPPPPFRLERYYDL